MRIFSKVSSIVKSSTKKRSLSLNKMHLFWNKLFTSNYAMYYYYYPILYIGDPLSAATCFSAAPLAVRCHKNVTL